MGLDGLDFVFKVMIPLAFVGIIAILGALGWLIWFVITHVEVTIK